MPATNRFAFLSIALLSVVALANSSLAQTMTSANLNLSHLFDLDDVHQELDMTADQIADLEGLSDDIGMEIRRTYLAIIRGAEQPASASSDPEPAPNIEQTVQAIRDQEARKISEVLLPHQVKRLQELQIQLLGNRALLLNRVADKLQLSDKQRREVRALIRGFETRGRSRAMSIGGPTSQQKTRQQSLTEQAAKIEAEQEKQVMVILTPVQRRKLKDLAGEKFEFKMNTPQDKGEPKGTDNSGPKDRH